VQTTSPTGLTQLNSTRESWASRISATRSMLGYAWTMIELVGYPWVVSSSFFTGANSMDVICEGVLSECRRAPVVLFHTLMVASLVPPPEASKEGCQGHQAMACGIKKYCGKLIRTG
jgi:hypothetical protein